MRRSTVPAYLTQLRMVEGEGGGGDQGGGGGNAGGTTGGAGNDQGGENKGDQGGENKGGAATPFDHITDPTELRAIAARLQREAGDNRTKSRDQVKTQAAQDAKAELTAAIGKALGLTTDAKDPAELERQVKSLTDANLERDRELMIYRAALAPGMDVNVGRLLDSRSFMRTMADVDPGKDDAVALITDRIKSAVSSDSSLKSGRVAAGGGSVGHAGGAGDHHQTDLSKLHGETLLSAAYAQNSQK